MNIEEAIKNSMARMIGRKYNIEGVEVDSWYEEFHKAYFTGCNTCGHGGDEDRYEVIIRYSAPGAGYCSYTHEGTFTELIRELDTE